MPLLRELIAILSGSYLGVSPEYRRLLPSGILRSNFLRIVRYLENAGCFVYFEGDSAKILENRTVRLKIS